MQHARRRFSTVEQHDRRRFSRRRNMPGGVSGVIDLTFMRRVGCSTTRGLWLVTCMQLALAGGTPAEWFLLEGRGKKHCFCLRGGVREPAKHSSTKLSGNREVLFVGGLGWVIQRKTSCG